MLRHIGIKRSLIQKLTYSTHINQLCSTPKLMMLWLGLSMVMAHHMLIIPIAIQPPLIISTNPYTQPKNDPSLLERKMHLTTFHKVKFPKFWRCLKTLGSWHFKKVLLLEHSKTRMKRSGIWRRNLCYPLVRTSPPKSILNSNSHTMYSSLKMVSVYKVVRVSKLIWIFSRLSTS